MHGKFHSIDRMHENELGLKSKHFVFSHIRDSFGLTFAGQLLNLDL